MNERLARIRENERKSHTEIYTSEKLYHSDSWLSKPIKTVREISSLLDGYSELRVLDLGCGVGRNSIYIAERFQNISCIVDCVDLLPVAIEKLSEYASEHNVSSGINGICQSIEDYEIRKNTYDLILAVSSLEHVETQEIFVQKLLEIKDGIRGNGIVCLIINSNVTERNAATDELIEAQFEVNYSTETMCSLLDGIFRDWTLLKESVVAQEYEIPRGTFVSHLHTNVVTYVARKNI